MSTAGAAVPPAGPEFSAIPDEKPGDMIGRYKLLQRLGEGGCGVVYLAEQAEPVSGIEVAVGIVWKAGHDMNAVAGGAQCLCDLQRFRNWFGREVVREDENLHPEVACRRRQLSSAGSAVR